MVAKSGLKLRSQPNLSGDLIIKMPYQAEVVVLNKLDFSKEERIENRDGRWIYVSATGEKGYVFDRFLSKLKPSVVFI